MKLALAVWRRSSEDAPVTARDQSHRSRANWLQRLRNTALSRFGALLVAALAVGIFASNLSHYYPFFSDDGYISLRYAQRLLDGKGLTWTDGEYVEGYTNLAFILFTAALGSIFDLVTSARIVGVAGTALIAAGFGGCRA